MLFDHLPPITPMSCESPSPREKCPHRWRKGSVFDRGGEFRRPISTKARALVMDRAEALERSTKAPGQRDLAVHATLYKPVHRKTYECRAEIAVCCFECHGPSVGQGRKLFVN